MPRNVIPDGWTDYSPVGRRMRGTPFVCFKVPLKETLCKKLDSHYRFGPHNLLNVMQEYEYDLKLVIDLTNTDRYYDAEVLRDAGVKVVKLMVPGGGEVPPESMVKRFNDEVRNFKEVWKNWEATRKVIGVHCTHGINRTGYFVCSYLIENEGWDAKEALTKFDDSRGHSLERKNYVERLYARQKEICSKIGKRENV